MKDGIGTCSSDIWYDHRRMFWQEYLRLFILGKHYASFSNSHKKELTVIDENYLNQKLEWVKYRLGKLVQIEAKLVEMRLLTEYARDNKLSSKQIEGINTKLRNFQQDVIEMDDSSKNFWLENQ